jgi:integrase
MEGGVTVFMPKGRTCYYVFFRHRKHAYNRSCGTAVYSNAVVRAGEIVAEIVRPTPKEAISDPTKDPIELTRARGLEIGVEELLGFFEEWIRSAKPGQKRPSPETAANYRRRLRQLCRLLNAYTIAEISLKLAGFNPELARMSDSNFFTMLRNAAAAFGEAPMKFYATKGIAFESPFEGCVPTMPDQAAFQAPTEKFMDNLKAAAITELKGKRPREWLLFLLTLGAGLRIQEATHLTWGDVQTNGIDVRSTKSHRTKSGRSRFIPVGLTLLKELEALRSLPLNWVIADGNGKINKTKVAKIRCSRAIRRLSKWLKTHGISARNQNHYLRKTFGSFVAQEHGVLAASRFLGHSSICVTEKVYVGLVGGGPVANVI